MSCAWKLSRTHDRLIGRLLKTFAAHVTMPARGAWRRMDSNKIWLRLVAQVCVSGASRHISRLMDDEREWAKFARAVSLRRVLRRGGARYLAKTLEAFGATRFPTRAATKLTAILREPDVFRRTRCILPEDLGTRDAREIRNELQRRCPQFGMKSASDFMINVGLSRDVVALDIRVVGVLGNYFGLKTKVGEIQRRPELYEAIEDELRRACRRHRAELGVLDRVIFQMTGKTALEFEIEWVKRA